MSISASIKQSSSLAGSSFSESTTVTGEAALVQDVTVPAAQDGTLSVRTSSSIGTITMTESAHTITTGEVVDLYWTGGQRRGVTVGTVSGASVPISGGSGDALPSVSSAILVSERKAVDVEVTGANVNAALVYSAKFGQATFVEVGSSDSEIASWVVGAGVVKTWHDSDGDDNPFTGYSIDKIYLSQKDTTGTQTARVGIVYDNA